MNKDTLARNYSYHAPTQEAAQLHEGVRNHCAALAFALFNSLPECREKSLALTKLEEVMFWSNAAIAREVSAPATPPTDDKHRIEPRSGDG